MRPFGPSESEPEGDVRIVATRGGELEDERGLVHELGEGAKLVTSMMESIEVEIRAGTKRASLT
jgi:hypothetical protein